MLSIHLFGRFLSHLCFFLEPKTPYSNFVLTLSIQQHDLQFATFASDKSSKHFLTYLPIRIKRLQSHIITCYTSSSPKVFTFGTVGGLPGAYLQASHHLQQASIFSRLIYEGCIVLYFCPVCIITVIF